MCALKSSIIYLPGDVHLVRKNTLDFDVLWVSIRSCGTPDEVSVSQVYQCDKAA